MERNIDMKEVSDGRLYTSNDLVKADCGGCLLYTSTDLFIQVELIQ